MKKIKKINKASLFYDGIPKGTKIPKKKEKVIKMTEHCECCEKIYTLYFGCEGRCKECNKDWVGAQTPFI